MGDSGSPYGRLQKALRTGNSLLARAAAAELERVPLADAVALTLLMAEQEPELYDRAAVRLLGRMCLEIRGLTVAEAQLVAAALAALPDSRQAPAVALAKLCSRYRLRGAVEALDAFAG